jgi:hypothetical protein
LDEISGSWRHEPGLKRKNFTADTINLIYGVYVYESVNLDDGDSAIVESPFLFYCYSNKKVVSNDGIL